jgi:hypothetical protein
VDLYAAAMTPKEVVLGRTALVAGNNPIVVRIIAKNPGALGFNVGIDAFMLR